MIKFDIITIFPDIFQSYFNESIIKRAQKRKLIKINIHNLRDYTDKSRPQSGSRQWSGHKSVDDKPYGGGAGMVMMVEPIFKAIKKINPDAPTSSEVRGSDCKRRRKLRTKVILFSAKGKKFTQAIAKRFSKLDRLIMICGRYEGVDERVAKYIADEEISIGDYVLTGGEIPAMILIDAVTRLIPGVIKKESLKEETSVIQKEYPQYTRPENFRGWKVPEVLLSGNHKKIQQWREKHKKA
jgi:tRNA (guanine37-N1)-methyltransferase